MKGFHLTRNFWVALVTIIVIGLLFTYYLMVYVKDRERLIYEKKFRELERVAKNIDAFKEEHKKRIEGYLTQQILANAKANTEIEIKNYRIDSLELILYYGKHSAQERNELKNRIDGLYIEVDALNAKPQVNIVEVQYERPKTSPYEITFQYTDEKESYLHYWVKINLADSLKKSLFQNNSSEFFLIRMQEPQVPEVTYEAEINQPTAKDGKSPDRNAKIIFQNLSNGVRLQNIDSLLSHNNGLSWSGVKNIRLGNTEYKLFTHWLELDRGDDLLLCAIEKADTIKSEATSVEPWLIINMASILLFLFMGMPLLKLLIMNEVERLHIVNVFFTGISVILGTAVIILFINFTNHFFGYHHEAMDENLTKVSNAVKGSFFQEVESAYTQIRSLNGKLNKFKQNKDTILVYNKALQDSTIRKYYVSTYPLFNQIFWMKENGTMSLVLASNTIDTELQKLPVVNKRAYFQATINNELWQDKASDTNRLLYVDFIRSMLDGQYQAVVSTKLEQKEQDAVAIALSTKMFSLQHSNLPPGYQACIIDEAGDVKFHSTNTRSLQENFLEEVDFEPELTAAVSGRIVQHTSITYDKKRYRAHIQPLDGMPLYLVTFYSMEYYKTPMVLTVWFTAGLLLAMFSLIALHLGLLFSITYQPSKLKIRRFFLTWLRPKKPVKYRRQYLQSLTGCSLVFILLAVLLIFFPVSREIIVGILVTPVFLTAFHFRLYAERDTTEHKDKRAKNIKTFAEWTVALVLFIDVLACYIFDDLISFLWIIILQAFVAGLLYVPLTEKFKSVQDYLFPNTGYKKLYLYSTLLWLSLVSIFPVFYFYKYSYEEESTIWVKHLQLEAAHQYMERQKHIRTHLTTFLPSEATIHSMGEYQHATNLFSISEETHPTADPHNVSRYERFLFQLVPPMGTLINESGAQAYTKAADIAWYWKEECGTLTLHYRSGNKKAESIAVASVMAPYQFHRGEQAILFWLAIIAGGLMAYRTIRFALRNIYGFDIIKPMHEVVVSADFFKLSENRKKNFFMIGLPYSGKGKVLKDYEVNNTSRIKRINLQTQLERIPYYEDAHIVIVEHFEFGLNNHELNKQRLRLLQNLQARPDIQTILCSAVQPHVILDYYDRMESLTQHLKERDEFKNQYMEYKHAKRYWRSVLSGFVVIYLPLNPEGDAHLDSSNLEKTELNHGTFLPRLRPHVANQPRETFTECEDFILKVEDMATPYYHSLWNSFSNAEKRLLYDLAIDRFVNVKNISVIRALLQKGVLVISDSLQIFNKSFNNFILSVVNEDEEMLMQQEMRNKGSWNSVQLVLILVFLAMAVFVAFAQRDILQNFNALMTALGGVTALLLRFGGLFTLGSKPKE
jgi:hypothetical protein